MKASGRKNRHFPRECQPNRHKVKIKIQYVIIPNIPRSTIIHIQILSSPRSRPTNMRSGKYSVAFCPNPHMGLFDIRI